MNMVQVKRQINKPTREEKEFRHQLHMVPQKKAKTEYSKPDPTQ